MYIYIGMTTCPLISDPITEFSCTSQCSGPAACPFCGDDPGHAKSWVVSWTVWGTGQH
jgi:hypothetical protein